MAKSGSERVSKGVWHPSTASRLGHCHHGEGEMYCKGFITLPQPAILAIGIMGKVRCFQTDLEPYHTKPSWPLSSWERYRRLWI